MTEKNDTGFHYRSVVKLQSLAWYILAIWFALTSVLFALGVSFVETLSLVGLLIVLTVIFSRIVIMAEQFRRARLYRISLLCYLLLFILVVTTLERLLTQ